MSLSLQLRHQLRQKFFSARSFADSVREPLWIDHAILRVYLSADGDTRMPAAVPLSRLILLWHRTNRLRIAIARLKEL
tara:strand:+ start:385 stop:618 length:234 start_codon:yes stop_codon:yes gene_type:complete